MKPTPATTGPSRPAGTPAGAQSAAYAPGAYASVRVEAAWDALLWMEDTLGSYGSYRRYGGESRFVVPVSRDSSVAMMLAHHGGDALGWILMNGEMYPVRSWVRTPHGWDLYVNDSGGPLATDEVAVELDEDGCSVRVRIAGLLAHQWDAESSLALIPW